MIMCMHAIAVSAIVILKVSLSILATRGCIANEKL